MNVTVMLVMNDACCVLRAACCVLRVAYVQPDM